MTRFKVLVIVPIAVLLPLAARAQTCAPSQIQVNHDADLARDCSAGICVERACVDTLYRRITVCGHGFGASRRRLRCDLRRNLNYSGH